MDGHGPPAICICWVQFGGGNGNRPDAHRQRPPAGSEKENHPRDRDGASALTPSAAWPAGASRSAAHAHALRSGLSHGGASIKRYSFPIPIPKANEASWGAFPRWRRPEEQKHMYSTGAGCRSVSSRAFTEQASVRTANTYCTVLYCMSYSRGRSLEENHALKATAGTRRRCQPQLGQLIRGSDSTEMTWTLPLSLFGTWQAVHATAAQWQRQAQAQGASATAHTPQEKTVTNLDLHCTQRCHACRCR